MDQPNRLPRTMYNPRQMAGHSKIHHNKTTKTIRTPPHHLFAAIIYRFPINTNTFTGIPVKLITIQIETVINQWFNVTKILTINQPQITH